MILKYSSEEFSLIKLFWSVILKLCFTYGKTCLLQGGMVWFMILIPRYESTKLKFNIMHLSMVCSGGAEEGLGTTTGFNKKFPPLGWEFEKSVLPQGREDCQRWVDEDSRCTIHDRKPSNKPGFLACSYWSVWWVYIILLYFSDVSCYNLQLFFFHNRLIDRFFASWHLLSKKFGCDLNCVKFSILI